MLDFKGLTLIPAGLERLIFYVYPTFVVLISAIVYRKALNHHKVFALLISYAGIIVVYADQRIIHTDISSLLMGSAFVTSSAMNFAIFMVASGIVIKRMGSLRFTAYSMTVACLITSLHFSIEHGENFLHLPAKVYGLAFIMAIFSTVVPSFMMNAGIQRIGAGTASIISFAGPIGTLIMAYFLLDEVLTVTQVTGTSLVLAGVYVVSRSHS